jgi:hypothetical protein
MRIFRNKCETRCYASYLISEEDFWGVITPYILTFSWGRVLLEKLTGFQLVKKFLAFYETQ